MGDTDFLPAGRVGIFPTISQGNVQSRTWHGPAFLPTALSLPPRSRSREAGELQQERIRLTNLIAASGDLPVSLETNMFTSDKCGAPPPPPEMPP